VYAAVATDAIAAAVARAASMAMARPPGGVPGSVDRAKPSACRGQFRASFMISQFTFPIVARWRAIFVGHSVERGTQKG
jgi:hypothetical protein